MTVGGLDLVIDSSVPVGAGLSSSAALTCSVALAVNDLHGSIFTRNHLAAVCIRAENDGVGAPTGGMDQTIALFAEPSTALLLDCRDGTIEHIPFALRDAGFELMVIDTRVKHSLADGQYGLRRTQCVDAATTLGITSLRGHRGAGGIAERSDTSGADTACGHRNQSNGTGCKTIAHQ